MNYPQTVDELVKWDIFKDWDTFGTYTVITGFEGTGRCFWCGKEIEGRRRFCGGNSGCWTRYQEHFAWNYAKSKCLERYDYHCANCDTKEQDIPTIGYYGRSGMEVHHIVSLAGEDRSVSVYNIYWNLISFCHDCHLEVHAVMRPPKHGYKMTDTWEEALEAGQSIMEMAI